MFLKSIWFLFFILAASCTNTDQPEASGSAAPKEEIETQQNYDKLKAFEHRIQINEDSGSTAHKEQNNNDKLKDFEHRIQINEYSGSASPGQKTEAELDMEAKERIIIINAYNVCRTWVSIGLRRDELVPTVTKWDFAEYMTDNKNEFDIAISYVNHTPCLEIDEVRVYMGYQRFYDNFKIYCSQVLKCSVKDCAKKRNDVTILRMKKELEIWKQYRGKGYIFPSYVYL